MINHNEALDQANQARAKSLNSKSGTVVVDRILYDVVFNNQRQAYDLVMNGELQIHLTAFQMSKVKKDATEWLSN